tara:strand:+ start:721 stop:987 length:267 start_codon:yes stop_codon:yes gene_type:complete
MTNLRLCEFSCEYVGGYRIYVDLDECDSMDDIIKICVAKLNTFIKESNLISLKYKINNINYHVHDYTFEDILLKLPKNGTDIYICGHD